MIEFDQLKQRIESTIKDCEEIMESLDSKIEPSQVSSFGQLKEIEKTITNMQNRGLPIPDELRQLKLNLLATCDNVKKVTELKKVFIETISKIISLNVSIGKDKAEPAPKDKPTSHRSKAFPPDGTLCRFKYKEDEYNGQIKDGWFVVKGYGSFSSFSAASDRISNTSRNGWRDWELKVPGSNKWLLADIWRKKEI